MKAGGASLSGEWGSGDEQRRQVFDVVQDILGLDRVAPQLLESFSDQFTSSLLGLALVSDSRKLTPRWVSAQSDAGKEFMASEGKLWNAVRVARATGEVHPGEDISAARIQIGEDVAGILAMLGSNPQDVNLLEAIAAACSQLASQLEETDDARRLSRELHIINSMAKTLAISHEVDGILVAAMQGVWELFRIEVASIALMDFDTPGRFTLVPLTGEPGRREQFDLAQTSGIIAECLQHRATALVEDVSKDPRFNPEIDVVSGFETRSMLCVPLLARERTLGAIVLINKLNGVFSKHDFDLLATFSASLSAALANAKLFHELSASNRDLQASRLEISRSRNRLLALVDNLDDELYIVDHGYQLVAVNRARADRVGRPAKELVGNICYQVLEGREKVCTGCRAHETFVQGVKTKRTERVGGGRRGSIEHEIFTFPIEDAQGMVSQTILQIRDVTEQRRLEASLAQAEKLAALGQLAAGVAHELNNPITAVVANAQLLERELEAGESYQESLDLIQEASRRSQKAVRDLLDFARPESANWREIAVNDTVRLALGLLEAQLTRSGVELIVDLAPDLPAVMGSSDQLQTVWVNLLLNARDALEGREGRIVLSSRQIEDQLVVRVEDTGKGIDPEDLNRIFEPFFSTKAPGKGTGLGLATTYRIVQQHAGSIDVQSVPKRGTTVSVSLPIKDMRSDHSYAD